MNFYNGSLVQALKSAFPESDFSGCSSPSAFIKGRLTDIAPQVSASNLIIGQTEPAGEGSSLTLQHLKESIKWPATCNPALLLMCLRVSGDYSERTFSTVQHRQAVAIELLQLGGFPLSRSAWNH